MPSRPGPSTGADPGPGDIVRFGIGTSSNGHQGTFAIDNVRVYSGVVVLLGGITLLAGYLPARRAAGMDAMVVLKAE